MAAKVRKKSAKSKRPTAHPPEIQAALNLAITCHEQGNLVTAERIYRDILRQKPSCAQALHMLGVVASQTGHFEEASELISKALQLAPDDQNAHFNLAVCLQHLGNLQQAERHYRTTLKLAPKRNDARANLAIVLRDLDRLDEAITLLRKAVEQEPDHPELLNNLATLVKTRGDFEDSIPIYRKALAITPEDAELHFNLAGSLLVTGKLEPGWREYSWRWRSQAFMAANPVRPVPYPMWQGENLAGKRLFIRREQGIGDEIMFATCLPDLMAVARHCTVECDPRLSGLLRRSFPGIHICTANDPLPAKTDIDLALFAGDLPSLFRTNLQHFPTPSPRLMVDPKLAEQIDRQLATLVAKDKPLIGLSWRGGREPRVRATRSIPLSQWAPLLKGFEAHWINLQYGDCQAELEASGLPIVQLPGIDPMADLESFAALVQRLDLVISIDNSTVHLSGAVGTPCWVLLPKAHDWRWFSPLETSPWYDSLRLFRRSSQYASPSSLFCTISQALTRFFPTPVSRKN
ncbi:tetratricopeptide repeat protein [Geothermobacter ehrlichii]|uniref:Tetratricopeptide repeat protein n=1 Tax=Geothermobacter ehrlichii TaxID=213224 RepID=A0A5D3WNR9_9BACT|nr:tetratricopeptide repeat protein [Geothermobacter ehrlichii]TYP00175.1 tetratricopeptide repeat protein [Geothermobacter ehrlichii]